MRTTKIIAAAILFLITNVSVTFAWDECPWPASPCCVFKVGDINGDGSDADTVDISYLVDYLFNQGPAPVCDDEADLNLDGIPADPTDLAVLVDHLFGQAIIFPGCP